MKKINIGIAGLGTVGRGVYEIIKQQQNLLNLRTNLHFEISAVASRTKKDFVDSKIQFYNNILDLANDPQIDIIVEVMGGIDGSFELIECALKNRKKVVTANKALLATRGQEIQEMIDKYQGVIAFEASVAGANPVIKAFKEGFVANEISEVYGILNGTCNFILSKMKNEKQDYFLALKQAQELGFAEADPTFDVEGNDTAHKIILLSCIASSSLPNYSQTYIEGINKISIEDINLADELDYKIKLLGVYKKFKDNIFLAVYPALIKADEKIAQVDGSYNAVLTKGNNFENNLMIGRGAGGRPTGSAVVADIVDIATNRCHNFLFNAESINLGKPNIQKIDQRFGKYFIIFNFDKNIIKQNNVVDQIFSNRLKLLQAVFKENDSQNNQITGAILTDNHHENEIIETLSLVDKNFVTNIKFIRVEQTNF